MSAMTEADDRIPVALTIAGSDPSGGAGIQADLKTFTALGVYGAAVITALTAQNTTGVSGVLAVAPDFITRQIEAVATDLNIAAVKTGMLGDRATVAAVADAVARFGLRPLVVDPVMVATSGDPLLAPDAVEAVRTLLLPRADVLTPNLAEAARLLEVPPAGTVAEMETQAARLLAFGPRAVLLKGGHGAGAEAVDVLATRAGFVRLARPRIATLNTHGTGCTLSAAIAAHLAQGRSPVEAVSAAKDFVWQALKSGAGRRTGAGHGPVDHLFALRDVRR